MENPGPRSTVNYGARFDVVQLSFDENGESARVTSSAPTDSTTMHVGLLALSPPPGGKCSRAQVSNSTTHPIQPEMTDPIPVRTERANYFDVGVSQKLARFDAGVDGYYNMLTTSWTTVLFGQTLILSAFTMRREKFTALNSPQLYARWISTYATLPTPSRRG